jgi:hypothetical protein
MPFFAKLDKNISGINSFVNKLLITKTIHYLRKFLGGEMTQTLYAYMNKRNKKN